MYKNSDQISSKVTSLDKQFLGIIKDNQLESSLGVNIDDAHIVEKQTIAQEKQEKTCCEKVNDACVIFSFDEIVYYQGYLNDTSFYDLAGVVGFDLARDMFGNGKDFINVGDF